MPRTIGETYAEEYHRRITEWRLDLADIDRWATEQEDFYDAIDSRLELPTIARPNGL